ncbi:hypothetical protein [Paenibacillus senegalimassiliensis]|uniref:hypothetical protein n=1 Tax=Paenibacillus senegalimassiliensis TaxID=1737426 RepID=UPI00073E7728|nr:hypothetical protein [Paenibacillus senegalimassiliensis]
MNNELKTIVEPLIRKRLELMYSKLLKEDAHYSQFCAETNQHFKLLRQALPLESQHQIFLYEDAQLSLQSILEINIYIQGFKDALHIVDEIYHTYQ